MLHPSIPDRSFSALRLHLHKLPLLLPAFQAFQELPQNRTYQLLLHHLPGSLLLLLTFLHVSFLKLPLPLHNVPLHKQRGPEPPPLHRPLQPLYIRQQLQKDRSHQYRKDHSGRHFRILLLFLFLPFLLLHGSLPYRRRMPWLPPVLPVSQWLRNFPLRCRR